jgi:ELWxxDGT repeat protein
MPLNLPPEVGASRSLFLKRPAVGSTASGNFGFNNVFDVDTPTQNLTITVLEVPSAFSVTGKLFSGSFGTLAVGTRLADIGFMGVSVDGNTPTAASGTFRFSVSDGTTTVERSVSINVTPLAEVQPMVFFSADTGNGRQLYTLSASNTPVQRSTLAGGLDPTFITATPNNLYMAGGLSTDRQLYVFNDTVNGDVTEITINATGSADVRDLVFPNGPQPSLPVFFTATDGINGRELWKVEGTTATMMGEANVGAASSNPQRLTPFSASGNLWFTATSAAGGTELWHTTGVGNAIAQNDILAGTGSSNPTNLTVVGNQMFFMATDSAGPSVYRVNSSNTVTKVATLPTGSRFEGPNGASIAFGFNNEYYFAFQDAANGKELWKATNTTISRVSDVNSGAGSSDPVIRAATATHLFFTATNPASGNELYKVTTAGVVSLVAELGPGAESSSPINFTTLDGVTYFTAVDALGAFEQSLYRINADATVTRVKAFDFAVPNSMFASNGRLIFNQAGELGINQPVLSPQIIDKSDLNALDSNFSPSGITTPSAPTGFTAFSALNPSGVNLAGTPGFDAIRGDFRERNNIGGGDGDDTLFGGLERDTLSGGNGNDSLDGSRGADSLIGGAGNDTILGGGFSGNDNDTINGGDGDDHLIANAGFDLIIGGLGNDLIEGGEVKLGVSPSGNPSVEQGRFFGGEGNDTIIGGWGEFEGNDGDDLISTDGGNDSISGGAGSDTLFGGGGNDTITGGRAVAESSSDPEGQNFLDGGAGNDRLIGGINADTLIGGFGNDELFGDLGNDLLDGGDGDDFLNNRNSLDGDTMIGGNGRDTLFGGSGSDLLSGGNGRDSIEGNSAFDSIDGADTIDGGADDDRLFGFLGNDLIMGGSGNDFAEGGDGNDSMLGGTGSDVFQGGLGNDTMRGEQDADQLSGDDGADALFGDDGNDFLLGGADNDTLNGGTGADALDGGAGFNTASYANAAGSVQVVMYNTAFNTGEAAGDTFAGIQAIAGSTVADILVGDFAVNAILGGGGDDWIDGTEGGDFLFGETGNDNLVSHSLADVLDGGDGFDLARYDFADVGLRAYLYDATQNSGFAAGDTLVSIEGIAGSHLSDDLRGDANGNVLFGLTGNDFLIGLGGADILNGGTGMDLFHFVSIGDGGATGDIIQDFVSGTDRISVTGAFFGLGSPGGVAIDSFRFVQGSTANLATSQFIYNGATQQLFYDQDGTGAGTQVLLATLQVGATMAAGDIIVL